MKTNFRTYIFLVTSLLITAGLVLPPQAVISQKSVDASAKIVSPQGEAPVPYLSKRSRASKDSTALFEQTFLPDRNKNATLNSAMRAQSLQEQGIEGMTYTQEAVVPSEYNGDLRNLPQVASKPRQEIEPRDPEIIINGKEGESVDSGVNNIPTANMPSPIQNFDGLAFNTAVTGGQAGAGSPPDINGDVGPSHYIEAVNDAYAIYNKSGTLLAAFTENSLWSGQGVGTACNANGFGDPVVIYDQFADRWILTNLGLTSTTTGPFYQCFAVSKTSDPVAGGWWFYALRMDPGGVGMPPVNTLNDYGKFGNWNDGCLYMGANGFLNGGPYNGAIFASFNKNDMESGAALTWSLGFITTTTNPVSMFPSNISSVKGAAFVPPANTPNYFVNQTNGTPTTFEVRKFTPGNTPKRCGGGGTMGAATAVTHATFTNPASVPQPGTTQTLDSLGNRIMQKVQYRKVGAAESVWVVHSVRPSAGATNRPQWAQLDVTGGVVATTTVQEQIYAPDTTLYRWMGSLAVDHLGNMALGYSTSNGTSPNFPSIAYSGRLVTDPLNQLPQGETQLFAGTGSHTSNNRWGDYTSMSVDPIDDCTFWYTNMYYDASSGSIWRTRIGSFKFPTCTGFPSAADANIAGQVLDTAGKPLAGVSITLNGPTKSLRTVTDSAGSYSFRGIASGDFYTLSPSLANYNFSPASRSFSLGANMTDAGFTAEPQIASSNAIDAADFFVRQHYLDFLNREPDFDGLMYWSDQIQQCGTDQLCINNRRIDVSAAYFIENEFQQTGSFVYGLYKTSFGRNPKYTEFMPDRSMVIGGADLEQSKAALAESWVARSAFKVEYPDSMTNAEFVNKLYDMAGLAGHQTERQNSINMLNSGGTRAQALRGIIDSQGFRAKEYNQSFVLMEYFGYLRRDPDQAGLEFWVDVLNREPTNYRGMVCSFLTSTEYQKRFSSVVTHSNQECGQ